MTPEEQAAADAAAKATADATKAAGVKATDGTPPPKDGDKPEGAQGVKDGEKPNADGETPLPAKAPDKYDLKLEADTKLDPKTVARFEKMARTYELSNEDAQALLVQQDVIAKEIHSEQLAELTADKTYGGDNLATTQRLAMAALEKVRPATHQRHASVQALLKTGIMDNIEFASLLADFGRLTLEDSVVNPGKGNNTEAPKTMAQRLYPNTPDYSKQ